MHTLREAGKKMLFWGALALMIWAGYELSVRWDTLEKATNTVRLMAADLNASLFDVLFKYAYFEALKTPAFLAGCVIAGLLALLLRARPLSAIAIIPLCGVLLWQQVEAKALFSVNVWQMLKFLPLLLVILGSAINLVFYYYIKKRRTAARKAPPPGTRHFQ